MMPKKIGLLAAATVGAAAMLGGSAAEAASVTFTTSGVFTAGLGDTVGPNTITSGASTITFAPQLGGGPGNPPFTANLGAFTTSSTASGTPTVAESFAGAAFTLTITATSPAGIGSTDSKPTTASITGAFTTDSGGATILSFSPDPVVLITQFPTVGSPFTQFTTFFNVVDQLDLSIPNDGLAVNLTARVTQEELLIPTPAAGLGGLALMGVTALRRSRRVTVSA